MKKSLYLFGCIVLTFLSCEKEAMPITENGMVEKSIDPELVAQSLNSQAVPSFTDKFVNNGKGSKIELTSKPNANKISINSDNIIVIKDSVGNRTFSALMLVPRTPQNVFYNVVAKQNSDGSMNEPFVLRYEINKDYYSTYAENRREDAPFKGELALYSLNDFLETSSSSGKSVLNDEPCETHYIGGGTTTGGSSNGGRPPNGTRPATTPGLTTPTVVPVTTPGKPRRKPSVEVGTGTFGPPESEECDNDTANLACKQLRAAKPTVVSDCPKEKLLVPINEDDDIFIIPSCKSFEYADGVSNGIKAKIAGTSNIHNFFAAGGFNADGSPYYHSLELNITKGYFVVYGNRTNGTAANQTAGALRAANIATKAWFLKNPKVSSTSLSHQWNQNIKTAMKAIGGEFTTNPSFKIKSLAPFTETFAWYKNDCR